MAGTVTHEEALFWPNDHIGEHVTLLLVAKNAGEDGTFAVETGGPLHHWGNPNKPVDPKLQGAMTGFYVVGSAHINLTELSQRPVRDGEWGKSLTFELCAGVELVIIQP